jgi:hypothetical protein
MRADITYQSKEKYNSIFYLSILIQKKNRNPNINNHQSTKECKTERSYLNTVNEEYL